MEQFEQLLTCAICLDRYRNPKLLPCQHSFCMEPCMDGLVDYVRRQVKCPECRAEHRIPYQGVQAFPTNVTLQRFLELHIEITGELPDPTSGQIMERCNICSEKAYCSMCIHCDKKCCSDCKSAHMDILRREISRINNQIRRGINRLQDSLSIIERNMLNLQTNCTTVSEEIDEINRRLSKAIKDRTEYLRTEIDKYVTNELKSLTLLKDNLELEINNIQSNCDLADKYINEDVSWDDCELMDAKDLFLKTVEFIRNFEYETSDYTRRVRFVMTQDPNQLVLQVANYGDLNIHQGYSNLSTSLSSSNLTGNSSSLQLPSSPGLMRSKSDHRLAYKPQVDDRSSYDGQDNENSGRKFGERYRTDRNDSSKYYGGNDGDYDNDSSRSTRSRYRSRLLRYQDNDSDTEPSSSKSVRFNEQKERKRVFDTEDAARGPLSGIFRLYDSPRVMQRLHDNEIQNKKKEREQQISHESSVASQSISPIKRLSLKQNSEDEAAKLMKLNKNASILTGNDTDVKPKTDRINVLKFNAGTDDSDDSRHSSPSRRTLTPKQSIDISSEAESDESVQDLQKKSSVAKTSSPIRKILPSTDKSSQLKKSSTRSISSDSSTSDSSSTATPTLTSSKSQTASTNNNVRNTGAAYSTEEMKKKFLSKVSPQNVTKTSANEDKKVFQSRFLNKGKSDNFEKGSAEKIVQGRELSESSTEEETDSDEDDDSDDNNNKNNNNNNMANTDIGPLLARSAHARDSSDSSRKGSKDENLPLEKNNNNNNNNNRLPHEEEKLKLSSTNRLNGKNSDNFDGDDNKMQINKRNDETTSNNEGRKYPPSSRYIPYKERKLNLSRSKSSHVFADDDDFDDSISLTSSSPNAYLASKGYSTTSSNLSNLPNSNDISRSRSTHALKSRETSPDKNSDKDGSSLSSWARYLKSKYGNRNVSTTKDKEPNNSTSSSSISSPSSSTRRLSSNLEEDQKNIQGSLTSPTRQVTAQAAVAEDTAVAGSCHKSMYLQKKTALFKIGSRGSDSGCFTWPRGIAVGPDNTIVVADSSNHRVQVFDSSGRFLKEFGQYGNYEGEFDCLADVVINRIGQFIVSDRYNHRIQVFDPSGRFLRSFGSQGSTDGRFNYPWGIATDSLGFIYVCDKENHRIQVFQSDGTFVGKFGSYGNKLGQMDHPHYISVSNTNRVIISDTNNHRIQIFDVNGRALKVFGSEGTEKGQFKFPRGVTVDDQGYIFVADSGNNRIQIFSSDGIYLHSFGTWGSEDGEFKGLEGIAITSNCKILVCDRENHRIQAF